MPLCSWVVAGAKQLGRDANGVGLLDKVQSGACLLATLVVTHNLNALSRR